MTKKSESRRAATPDFITMYQQRVDSLQGLKIELRNAFGGASPKVIVFVDELDRCRPDYAVSYLETIKHVFDVEGMAFILAVDRNQLQVSVEALFGEGLNFEEYFCKFCHRSFMLPDMTESAYRNITNKYVDKYLAIEGKRMSRFSFSTGIARRVAELTHTLHMRPRQVQEAFRIMGHTMQTYDEAKKGTSVGVTRSVAFC